MNKASQKTFAAADLEAYRKPARRERLLAEIGNGTECRTHKRWHASRGR
jgi:hypothetical protein